MKYLPWQELDGLSKKFGDSYYLIDLGKFQTNYQDFLNAFYSIYPKSQIAYSYKTNYTPRLCQLVNMMGGYAEVVSGMEYDLAVRIGVPAEKIIFNGPYKQQADFEKALLNHSIVNLDAMYEVERVCSLAARFPEKKFHIGLRCDFSIESEPRSRFGFDVEKGDFKVAINTLQKVSNCNIVGLHCHFLAADRSAKIYTMIAQKMIEVAKTNFTKDSLEFIDLGGGFFSPMDNSLKKQFPHPIPTFTEYGQAVAQVFKESYPNNDGPELILEPGISITANIMQFVTKVIGLKVVENKRLALVAGSRYDIKPTLSTRNLPMRVVPVISSGALKNGVFNIVGSTCMESDCLHIGYQGGIKENDYVVFDNVGAYTNVLRPPFINPAPVILSCNSFGDVEIIRHGETIDDIFSTYIF